MATASLHSLEIPEKDWSLDIVTGICYRIHEKNPIAPSLRRDIEGLGDLCFKDFLVARFVLALVEEHFALFTEKIRCRR